MLPDRVSNPGPLTYESGALPIALRGDMMAASFWHKMLTGLSIHRHVSLRIPCRPACIYLQSKQMCRCRKKMRTLIKLSGR